MNIRFATIRVVILPTAVLAIGLHAAFLHRLVSANVEPCPIAEDDTAGAERVRDNIHRATLVLADGVLCQKARLSG